MISEAFPKRILGSGTAAMTVSAIGFGAMGTTYHRGAAPEKKSLLSLLPVLWNWAALFRYRSRLRAIY